MILGGVSGNSAAEGTKSADAQAQLEEDLNRFLNLLVTQLKNQDPLDPMDSNEFTSQLVQFAAVEQQIFANSNLEELVSLQQMGQISSLVDFIDRTVEVVGTKFPLENGKAKFTYTMPEDVKSASVIIRDQNGITIYEESANLEQGQHTFEWDGLDKHGQPADDGIYNAVVTGLDRNSDIIEVSQTAFGRITGVGSEAGTPTIFLGDLEVPQGYIISVMETPETPTDTGTE